MGSSESTISYTSDAPITPPAAYHSAQQIQADQLANFFGDSRKSRTRAVVPPPYSSDGESQLSTHEAKAAEPVTLARFMFIYGFMFPPFWIMGLIILGSELRPTPDWEAGKTEDEKVLLLAEMRKAEVKWAKRCIYALFTLITIICCIVMAVVFAKRRSST